MRFKFLALALIVAGAACGIQSSGIDPNAGVTITGKAVGADGKPLVARRVVLIKELDLGEVVGGLFITAASLGLACLADHPPALCAKNARITTTESDGSYSFTVKGSDTQGSFGVASTMEVLTRAPAGDGEAAGPTSLAEFNVQATSLTLPDLRIWQPKVGLAIDGRATWQSVPSTHGNSPTYSVEVNDSRGNQWWAAHGMRPGDRIDPRVLEDISGTFDVMARTRGAANGTTVDWTYVSGAVAVQGHVGAPPSRRGRCAPLTSNGGVGTFGTCPVTSGATGGPSQLLNATNGLVVDLGSLRSVSFLVLRGCGVPCKMSVSADLETWTEIASVSGAYATTTVTPSRTARYLRVTGSKDLSGLRQVSAW